MNAAKSVTATFNTLAQNNSVSVSPPETDELLANPLAGFAGWSDSSYDSSVVPITLVFDDVFWYVHIKIIPLPHPKIK